MNRYVVDEDGETRRLERVKRVSVGGWVWVGSHSSGTRRRKCVAPTRDYYFIAVSPVPVPSRPVCGKYTWVDFCVWVAK
jgi:hypothetical protein